MKTNFNVKHTNTIIFVKPILITETMCDFDLHIFSLSGINAGIMKCIVQPPLYQSPSRFNMLSTYGDIERLTCLGLTPR